MNSEPLYRTLYQKGLYTTLSTFNQKLRTDYITDEVWLRPKILVSRLFGWVVQTLVNFNPVVSQKSNSIFFAKKRVKVLKKKISDFPRKNLFIPQLQLRLVFIRLKTRTFIKSSIQGWRESPFEQLGQVLLSYFLLSIFVLKRG